MIRIALVLAGPYPAFRGSQVLLRQLEGGLSKRGHRVTVVTYGAHRGLRPGLRPSRVVLDALLMARLFRIVRRERIDVIHAHNYEAAIAALVVGRATRRPVVYHGHSAMREELPTYVARGGPAREILRVVGHLLDTRVPRRADFCIAVTDELGAHLRRGGVDQAALACIAPVAPVEPVVGAHGRPAAEPLVCYAGNLDGYQNLDFLVTVFAAVRAAEPSARLVLISHADARDGAAALARRGMGAGVEIVQAGTYDEVRERLADAQVAVLPRAERSGFPMKLLNYMAAGKAVVACAGSAKGLRHDVTGVVVPDGDVSAFATAVVGLLRDPARRDRLGAAARSTVESPEAWEQVLDRIESIYRRVLAGGTRVLVPVPVTE